NNGEYYESADQRSRRLAEPTARDVDRLVQLDRQYRHLLRPAGQPLRRRLRRDIAIRPASAPADRGTEGCKNRRANMKVKTNLRAGQHGADDRVPELERPGHH